MTIALWCVLLAALLPFPFAVAAKWSRRFDNANPRDYLASVEGWRKRAHAAQLNSFEAFPPFAAGVIIAQMLQAPQDRIDGLAVGFIVLRLIYGLCYLANAATLRSLVWSGAMACTVALYVIAA